MSTANLVLYICIIIPRNIYCDLRMILIILSRNIYCDLRVIDFNKPY